MEAVLTNPLFLVFGCPFLLALGATLAYYWHKARRDALEAALKQDMLERGMSADDIVKVLKASRYADDADEQGSDVPAKSV